MIVFVAIRKQNWKKILLIIIDSICQEKKLEKNRLLKKIKHWYNGYNWGGEETIYNPFAVLNFFDSYEFRNYWFQTATPSFLIKLIKKQQVAIEDFEGYKGGKELFDSFETDNLDPVSLLFQTGYLTIKGYQRGRYLFGYPNYEVKESFLVHLFAVYANIQISKASPVYLDLLDYLAEEKIVRFKTALTALFAGIPSQLHLDQESYYHSLCYLILALLGAEIILEENTDKGRIDAVLKFEKLIYIIEFKMDKAATALAQIKDKQYYEKYLEDERKIILLGVAGFREKEIEILSEELVLRD